MDKSTKVLVVDDDRDLLALTSEVLRRGGYQILEASTGEECLETVRTQHPDLVLLDVMLPDATGVQVCKQIKANQQLRGTLVILISGVQVSSDYQADALNVGADGYIVKPISNKELLARVQAMERIKRAEEALQASELRYRRLFETALDGILILDGDTAEIDDVNPSLIEMLGYSREELLGKKLWEIGLFQEAEAGKAAFMELHDKGSFRYRDLQLETKLGREIAVECAACNVHAVDGKKVIQCNIRDITELKIVEDALRKSEASLREQSVRDHLTG
jgi:PAS domain S-box-containing protein